LARAEVARNILPLELENFGAEVTIANAYKTESTDADFSKFADKQIDLVTFTSSSTVENFVTACGEEFLHKVKTAAIGPVTAQSLKKFGVEADIVAKEFTIEGLVKAILDKEEF